MTAITLDETYHGQLEPDWWVGPFFMGVLVGAGVMIAIVTVIFAGKGIL